MVRKKLYIIVALVVVCIIFYYLYNDGKNLPEVKQETVISGNLKIITTATGHIEAARRIQVNSTVPGKVAKIYFTEFQKVDKGDILIELENEDINAQLRQVQASLEKAKIEKKYFLNELKKYRQLYKKGYISQKELDFAKNQYDLACSLVKQQFFLLESVEANLKNTIITSPLTGTVIKKEVEEGEIVKGPIGVKSLTEITAIAEIADLTRLFVFAEVDETEITKIYNGQKAIISVDAYPELSFYGRVRKIAQVTKGQKDTGITYQVNIEIENPKNLKLGMTANIDFVIEEKDNVLLIPASSILEKPDGQYIFLIKDERVYLMKVQLGISNEDSYEVISGLKQGDIIASGRLSSLKNGQGVKIID
ncbi:MAG: efflux RND transporter periplasmic adaptor subunit [Thermodesulfobacteriota bacterium]|nr:efflux RND transporter periplasmic adaptor subunit [Thermodesulfobacteriota bacterium]